MTKISRIVESGLLYEFEPPVETGSQEVATIADMTRIAMRGSEATPPILSEAINLQVNTLLATQDELVMKEIALNTLLEGKHKVRVSASL